MDTQQLVSPGREAFLATLAATLAQTRLLTLTGPGGVGKTWLARNLVQGREAHWVDLAVLAEGGFVVPAVAAACGIAEQGQKPWLELLCDGLRERAMVLVLDSCEHVREAVAELCTALLPACPTLTILATSRVPLQVANEQRVVVPSLNRAAAQALFVERAAARVPGFSLDAATSPLVAHICERLEGMPLALELAAARLPLLTTAQIAERLDQSLPLLAARTPELPARQRSLRATLDWSYGLLPEEAQALLRRLAIFVGSFELAAVEVVCELPTALDGLETLLDAGLVVIARREEAASTRYRLHEVVRQYAAELLAAAGEAETCRQRLVEWAVALAEQAGPALEGVQQALWKGRIATEQENLRAALAAAEQAGDAESMLQVVNSLSQFWNSGAVGEGRDWLRRALHLAGNQVSLATIRGWNLASTLAYRQGDLPGLRQAAETALGLAQRLEDVEGMAVAHHRLGIYEAMHRNLPAARDYYQQSLALYQEMQHQRGLLGVFSGLAHVAILMGQPAEARGYYERALTVTRAINDTLNTGVMLFNLGNLTFNEDWVRAEPLYAESLALMRAVGATSYLPHLA
ncbi:MAG: tetratricopeptide repeat protein, partial [Chloroflexaceae bacterium]|nr:tetratricopeptide repeat protein [Chloroflexaceae bacterium]